MRFDFSIHCDETFAFQSFSGSIFTLINCFLLRSNIRRGGGAEKQASHKEIHCVVPPANKGQFSFDFPPDHDFPPPPFLMEGTLCLVVTCYPLSYAMSYDSTWCPPPPLS